MSCTTITPASRSRERSYAMAPLLLFLYPWRRHPASSPNVPILKPDRPRVVTSGWGRDLALVPLERPAPSGRCVCHGSEPDTRPMTRVVNCKEMHRHVSHSSQVFTANGHLALLRERVLHRMLIRLGTRRHISPHTNEQGRESIVAKSVALYCVRRGQADGSLRSSGLSVFKGSIIVPSVMTHSV